MPRNVAAYNDYMRTYMLDRYHARLTEAVAVLGAKCVVCGASEALEIDHIDRKTKTMEISKLWLVSRERYLQELKLCQLLCEPHHREKTSREKSVPHGGGKTGKKNCYCDLCAPLKRKYAREHKAFKRTRVAGETASPRTFNPRVSGSNPGRPTTTTTQIPRAS